MNLTEKSKRILCTIISIPTVYIFAPMIKMFPVGLGLKILFVSGILIALVFGLMILTFHQKKTFWMQKTVGLCTIIFFGIASYNSGFSTDNKKPNSIVYIQNSDAKTAYFGTYNITLDSYTDQIFNESSIKGSIVNTAIKSKYNTRFKYHKKTDFKNIPTSIIKTELDTIVGNNRFLEFTISPERKINKLEFITNKAIKLQQFKVNDILVNNGKTYTLKRGTFLTYFLANTDKEITISFCVLKGYELDILLNEISYDLLKNQNFSITPRTTEMMPIPFVTNDAIIISKKLKL